MKYTVEVKFHEDFLTVEENRIIAGLRAKPERGEANRELVKKIAKHFKISTSQVKIISGLKSKNKIVEITDK